MVRGKKNLKDTKFTKRLYMEEGILNMVIEFIVRNYYIDSKSERLAFFRFGDLGGRNPLRVMRVYTSSWDCNLCTPLPWLATWKFVLVSFLVQVVDNFLNMFQFLYAHNLHNLSKVSLLIRTYSEDWSIEEKWIPRLLVNFTLIKSRSRTQL